jgi:hypothetical protein
VEDSGGPTQAARQADAKFSFLTLGLLVLDADLSTKKQKIKKTLDFYNFETVSNKQKKLR